MLLSRTTIRTFLAVKLLPTGIVPMLLPIEDNEDAGISIKELILPASSCLLTVVEMFEVRRCTCEEVCPKATGNCRFKARAELPHPGVEYMEFSEPRGIWKVVRGPLTSDGPPFMGVALTCTVDEFSTLNLISKLEVIAWGSPG